MKYLQKIKAHPILDMGTLPAVNMNVDVEDNDEDEMGDPTSALLQIALVGEYQQWDLYVAYASRLKGAEREPIADHFKEHAGDELGHIELLQRYLVSMGQNPTLQRKPLPEMSEDASIEEIVRLQLKFEMDAVGLYKKILNILPENEPLKLDIESIITKEQEHVHDLELMLKNEPVMACQLFRPTEPGEATKPQAGYGKGCGCGCDCQPFLSKVEHQWCTMALKELTPDIYARWYQGKLLSAQEKAFVIQAIALKWGLKDKRAMLRFLDSCKA